MNDLEELKKYFDVEELFGPKEVKRDGQRCWRYLSPAFVQCLLIIRRDILQVPMYCNNWKLGGKFSERGFRNNLCSTVKSKTDKGILYISPHMLGMALDFDAKGMTAEEARNKIVKNVDLLPFPIRLESGVSWVHMDTYFEGDKKVHLFSA